jgi:Icc-related predicted phosphoesterase
MTHVTRILCVADPRGSAEALARVLETAADERVGAVAVIGDLSADHDRPSSLRAVFRALHKGGLPSFWVPGPADAPVEDYLREAHNAEVVHPNLRGVHGTAASTAGHLVVAGLGGEIGDDPSEHRDEIERLRYPRWEPEYRLKILAEFDEPEKVLLFTTPPAHKGLGTQGSEAVAELAATYRARLLVCGGAPGSLMIGRTLVVAPGSLADGHYAVADLHAREAVHLELAGAGSRS